ELHQAEIAPAAAMWLDRTRRQTVMAQPQQRAAGVRLDQELDGRLAGRKSRHAAPAEYDLAMWHHLQIGAFHPPARGAGDTEGAAGPRVGLDHIGEPQFQPLRLGEKREHRFRRGRDPDLEPHLTALDGLAHFALLPRSAASAASLSRRSRGCQKLSTKATM